MALIKCAECGASVSNQAAACPKCGAPKTAMTAKKPASESLGLGCLALIGVSVLLGLVGRSCSAADERASAARLASQRANADSVARASDSVKVWEGVNQPQSIDASLALDELVHRWSFSVEHTNLHLVSVKARLDSARALLRNKSVALGAVGAVLQGIHDPIPDELVGARRAVTAEVERRQAIAAAELALAARRQFAQDYEGRLLDKGLNVTVSTRGTAQTTLRLKWILVSKVLAHQMSQDPTLFQKLRDLGFKRFEITDGFDETWYWDLSK